MATLTSSLIVSLIDRVTGPAKSVAASVRGIGQAITDSNRGGLAKIAEANSQAVGRMRASILEAVAAAYVLKEALASPLSVAGKFESILLDIAQKSDLTDSAMKAMGARIRAIGPLVNKTAQEVAGGIDVLTSMGLDPTRALAIAPMLGKAATAYKAEMSDVAKMTFAAIDNLKVPVAETAKLLDVLSQASKEGAFEFKDMAREFPAIAASAQALGQKGVVGAARIAAALETIRKGTGSSAEAATNLQNVLQKITSPDTTKNFAKFGIDIRKDLKTTMAEGGDVVEMLADRTMKALGGDLTKLGDLFQDKQVQEGLRAFILNWSEYRRIRKSALEASGVVDTDFDRRMKTHEAQVEAFKIRVNELGITIGTILVPHVNAVLTRLQPMVERIRDLSEAHPALVGGIIKATTGLIGLRIAMTAGRYAALFLQGAVISVIRPVLALAIAMKSLAVSLVIAPIATVAMAALRGLRAAMIGLWVATRGVTAASIGLRVALLGFLAVSGVRAAIVGLGAALMALLNPLALVTAAMRVLKFAVIGTGIGAILVGIAAAGTFIYENWKGIGEFFRSFGASLMAALGPAGGAIQPLIDGAKKLWDTLSGFLGEISPATWAEWGASAGTAVGNLIKDIIDLPSKIGSMATELYSVGVSAIQGLWDGMKSLVEDLIAWVKTIPRRVVEGLAEIPGALKQAITGNPTATNDNEANGKPGSLQRRKAALRVITNPEDDGASEGGSPDGQSLDGLNQSVGPRADLTGLGALNKEIDRTKANIRELNGMSLSPGSSGGRLRAGGEVARRVRGEFSDAAQ